MLHGHIVGSHEGATVSERSTINSGLPHDYLHENLIKLLSAAVQQEAAVMVVSSALRAHIISRHPLCFTGFLLGLI